MKETPSVEETLYRMNGTLLREGDVGQALNDLNNNLALIADRLEKINWNFGTMAKALTKLSER